ncbi:MAG: hypothetical protein NTW87_17990 [Planctomycetota bacterium]|nr:hypothetical protein [Planctomycetota bacterium]
MAGCFLWLASAAAPAAETAPDKPPDKPGDKAPAKPAANAAPDWQKLETKAVPLLQPRQVASPGLFDPERQKVIVFPKDGSPVDTALPHAGKDKAGNDNPALLARLQGKFIWIDANGDGKAVPEETRAVAPDGFTDPFTCDLHYEDGTATPYSFRLKAVVEGEKYALIRATARVAEFQGQKIVLLDDNGNGRYDDAGQDAVIVGDGPVSLLGRYISLGGKFYETLVHAGGTTMEIRPAPDIETGTVDLFEKYTPSQKSENLKIHTLIISGTQGSFAFDDNHKAQKVPAGPYDLVFGLLERAKEWVYLKKGDKTSFTVIANQTVTPHWGGAVKAKFDVASDEKGIVVSPPAFFGEGSEQYFPENYRQAPVTVSVALVYKDLRRIERRVPVGSHKFDVLPDGTLGPVTLKPYRWTGDEYQVTVDYNSGIMGGVTTRQDFQFVPMRKKAGEKKP